MRSVEICNAFVEFYKRRGYNLLPSASLLDPSIPMSFVMSAGLVQVEKSLAQSENGDGNQYVLVQKCFRHFDVDKVGNDSTHLSFFEMPGAFIFGETDQAATIERMWTLATSVLRLPPKKLWASYFQGGEAFGTEILADTQSRDAWLGIGLPAERIVGLDKANNFWTQGNGFQTDTITRKCGPNTELFYDRGNDLSCGDDCKPGCICGRFVEFSNTLFIEYEFDPETQQISPIQRPFTETVIGAERVAMLAEGVASVFDTNEYHPIIQTIRRYIGNTDLEPQDVSACVNIIADHLKALYALVADGAPPPGKDGRRRIIKILVRRVFSCQILLGISSDEFLRQTIQLIATREPPSVVAETSMKAQAYFSEETQRFSKTIQRGRKQIAHLLDQNGGSALSASQILTLEQRWGLPQLLTTTILKNSQMTSELLGLSIKGEVA